jgi:hypothetical protein
MKYLAIRVVIAVITFVIGVFVTAQVNRAAYYIWPDVDPQPRIVNHDHHDRKPCVRIFVEKT